MSASTPVDWTELAPQLVDAARQGRAWYLTMARGRVVAVDAHPAVLDAARRSRSSFSAERSS